MVPTLPKQAANPVVPTLPVMQVNVPLLSPAKPIHEAMATALGSTAPIPPALTPLNVPLTPLNVPLHPSDEPLKAREDGYEYESIATPAGFLDLDKRAVSPSYMYSRIWVRGPDRTRQRVIPLRCMGATPDTHVPRDRPRWCHWTAFKGMGCRLCLGGRLQVIPCGIAAGPRLRKPPMEEGMAACFL